MNNERMLKWLCPLAVGFLAAAVIGFGVLSRNTPGENAPAAQVVKFYQDHGTRETAAVWVIGIGLGLLTFYLAGLRTALRQANSDHSWLANAAFGGGMIFVTGFAVTGITHYAVVQAAHNNHATLASDLNFVDQVIPLPLLLGVSVMGLATGAAILTSAMLPKWLGVVGIVMGVLPIAGPLGFFSVLALPVYFLILGIVLPAKLLPHEHVRPEASQHRMSRLIPRSHH